MLTVRAAGVQKCREMLDSLEKKENDFSEQVTKFIYIFYLLYL